ncbi:MAG TPA: L-fuculose-phosphate aldolase [Deltaproteobacteria bacterium]|nr:L-fuculose-phosphate aldolase [Deltaproteobacteria bacterium]
MFIMNSERNDIVFYGKKLITSNLTTGSGGNLSVMNRKEGLIAISPSGMEYFDTQPEDVVIVDLDGNITQGNRKPSSELSAHIELYRRREDINAVVHTHSVYATTIACLNWEIPAVHYLVGFAGTKVHLAPYATFGSRELAENVCRTIRKSNAVLLANHGLIAVGDTLKATFAVAEEIELVARIYYQARTAGKPVILPDEEMDRVISKMEKYGQ